VKRSFRNLSKLLDNKVRRANKTLTARRFALILLSTVL
jgi:hypothetical protein